MTTALLDVGGTWIRAASLEGDRPGQVHRCRTPAAADLLVDVAADLARQVAGDGEQRVGSVLVAIPGTIDDSHGVVTCAGNLGMSGFPLRARLERALGADCRLVNDTNAQAVGLAGDGVKSLLYVAVGSGVGGALVDEGRLISGGGFAGEIGHVQVRPPTLAGVPPCYCGRSSCLELFASGMALERQLGREWWTANHDAHTPELGEVGHLIADAIDAARVLFDPRLVHVFSFLCRYGVVRNGLTQRLAEHTFPSQHIALSLSTDPSEHALAGLARLATTSG